MTTKELLDEFNERLEQDVFMFFNTNNPIEDDAWSLQDENRRYLYKVVNKTIEELEQRAKKNLPPFIEEIIKELETSIRKKVVEEIWKVIKDTDGSVGLRSVEIIKEIKEYALSVGITLK